MGGSGVGAAPVGVGPWKQRLRPYQVEAGRAILESVLHRRGLSFSVEMARQGGKNELSAQIEVLLLTLHALHDVDGVKCAPTFEPQARISVRRLWSRLLEAGLAPVAAVEAGHVVRLGRARLLFFSAEPEANVVGHSAQLLLEVDEAQDVDEEKFDREFRPMASTANATTVFYGTAWDDRTLLERAKQHHLELERRDGIRRHFEYDWEVVAQYNPAYQRYVESERERLGEQHPLFLTQYCLKPISGGGRLFTPGQLAQLQGRHARQRAPRAGETYVAGLDLGGGEMEETGSEGVATGDHVGSPLRGDRDATVLTIARASYPAGDALVQEPSLEVVEQYAWTGEPHDALLRRLVDLLREVWQVRRLAVDGTGRADRAATHSGARVERRAAGEVHAGVEVAVGLRPAGRDERRAAEALRRGRLAGAPALPAGAGARASRLPGEPDDELLRRAVGGARRLLDQPGAGSGSGRGRGAAG